MKAALLGLPQSGKSTIFSAISGKAMASNALRYASSYVPTGSGTFTQYPIPGPAPISSSNPVPGNSVLGF